MTSTSVQRADVLRRFQRTTPSGTGSWLGTQINRTRQPAPFPPQPSPVRKKTRCRVTPGLRDQLVRKLGDQSGTSPGHRLARSRSARSTSRHILATKAISPGNADFWIIDTPQEEESRRQSIDQPPHRRFARPPQACCPVRRGNPRNGSPVFLFFNGTLSLGTTTGQQ